MNIKSLALKIATLGTLAAAFVVASPAKADAQVSFGVRVGGPVYPYGHVRPYYAPPVYGGYYARPAYGWDRHEAWERHEQFVRHEERERYYDHRFYGR